MITKRQKQNLKGFKSYHNYWYINIKPTFSETTTLELCVNLIIPLITV